MHLYSLQKKIYISFIFIFSAFLLSNIVVKKNMHCILQTLLSLWLIAFALSAKWINLLSNIISHSTLTWWRLFECGLGWAKELFPQSGLRHWTHDKPSASRMDHLSSWTRRHTWEGIRIQCWCIIKRGHSFVLHCWTVRSTLFKRCRYGGHMLVVITNRLESLVKHC